MTTSNIRVAQNQATFFSHISEERRVISYLGSLDGIDFHDTVWCPEVFLNPPKVDQGTPQATGIYLVDAFFDIQRHPGDY
jgi:hypothetical protein